MLNEIRDKANALLDTAIAERRHFHKNPELGFQEFETSARIAEILEEIGFTDVKLGVAGKPTGVVVDLQGGLPGKTVALRGDIDALPIIEANQSAEYCSKKPGLMHACGHDAHAASLLCAARVLYSMRDIIPGRVRFLFQPAEETPDRSGARAMVADGVMEGVDAVFGAHVWAQMETGKISIIPGPACASADCWEINIKGKGGHGALPHLSIDPIPAACQVVSGLQTLVSRETDPLRRLVISTCTMHSGTAFNIIPEECKIGGTARCFNPELRAALPESMKRLADGIAGAHRCRAEVTYEDGMPATINDPAMAGISTEAGKEMFGDDAVIEGPPSMGSEDMSYFMQEVPGAYLFVGCRDASWPEAKVHHHPEFDIDEKVLPISAALLAGSAWKFLQG